MSSNELHAASDRIARRVLDCLNRYALGEHGEALDAEYEALFWEGEAVAEELSAAETAN